MSLAPDVNLEPVLLSVLFAVTAVAFIGVLNARGVWRTTVAAVLALFCLGAAVFHLNRAIAHNSTRVEAQTTVVVPATDVGSESGSEQSYGSDAGLNELLSATRALRDSLAAEDPTRARGLSDSAYQAFESRTDRYFTEARRLRESVARFAAEPPPGMDEAVEYLNLSLQPLVIAARDLNRFFKAESKEEELGLTASFRQNVQAAETPLGQAEARLGNPSPESAP